MQQTKCIVGMLNAEKTNKIIKNVMFPYDLKKKNIKHKKMFNFPILQIKNKGRNLNFIVYS